MDQKSRAFYEAPTGRPIPSSIINETRAYLNAVPTKRPFTPQTDNRSQFSIRSKRLNEGRPPRNLETSEAVDRPSSGSRLAPLNKFCPKVQSENKTLDCNRRHSDALNNVKDNTEQERHTFKNVDKSISIRTNSLTNLSNVGDKTNIFKPKKLVAQSESFASGLPPTSPTRNKPKIKSGTLNPFTSGDKRTNSAESSSRGSSAEYSSISYQTKPTFQGVASYGRPDSGSSCSSTSSANALTSYRSKGRSQIQHNESTEETDTPRPPNTSGVDKNSTNKSSTESDKWDQFYKDILAPIIDILNAPLEFRKQNSTEDFINLTKLLYERLEERNLLGKQCNNRADILKSVFKVLDSNNPTLVISAARIILAMKVRDVNLVNISKLIFKVSKDKNNDSLFQEYNMADLLVKTLNSIKPEHDQSALVYLMCTINFLSAHDKLTNLTNPINNECSVSASLVSADIFAAISKLLNKSADINEKSNSVNMSFADFLNQSFRCLVNFESYPNISRKDFIEYRIPFLTVTLIEQYHENTEVVFEACRLLSRLTQYLDCCQMIEPLLSEFCPQCLNLMLNSQNDHLVLRIAFIIGDLLTKSEDARLTLFPEKSKFDSFMKVFQIYIRKFQSTDNDIDTFPLDSNDKDSASVDDILVKLLRVLANAAISETVGKMIAASKTCLRFILTLISSKKILDKEELLTISISALNNISFYMTSLVTTDIKSHHIRIIEALYKIIVNKNGKEHLGGVIRVLGNLSRESYMRDWIVEKKLVEFLITMLDSDNQDTVFFTVGVILNLMTDSDKRSVLLKHNGISRLIEVLRDFASRDWQLAGLVCQTFWNYTETIHTTTESAFGGEINTEELMQLLTLFTDTEEVDNIHISYCSDQNTLEYLKNCWQTEFLPVALDLMARLEAKMNPFETL